MRADRSLLSALALAALVLGISPAAQARPSLIDSLPQKAPSEAGLAPYLKPVAGAYVFYEDFEHGMKRWKVQGMSDGVGWRLLEAHTCGGAYTMHVGRPLQAPYQKVKGESLLTLIKPLDLTKAKRPALKYDVKGVATPPGMITYQAEIKPQGGSWRPVGPVIDGRFVIMRSIYLDLSHYAHSKVGLRFRARYKPGSEPTHGLYLDDIQVIEAAR